MTNKPDWADKIAKSLETEHTNEIYESGWFEYTSMDCDEVAAALRKSKADGVRWAADMLGEGALGVPHNQLKGWADKIERGE